jgi:transglutaminase-like putative cysteine protease
MSVFSLRHATTYAFSSPVALSSHQLYLRPRGDHRLKVRASGLTLSPPADVVWRNDLYGNSVAIAHFAGQTTRLDIISELEVETFPRSEDQRRLLLEVGEAGYSDRERHVLAPFIDIDGDTRRELSSWIANASTGVRKSQYERLLACAARIRYEFDYRPRYEPGLQSPQETLRLYSGTCRDFAELMIAAARSLGCAARFVTGYVFSPNAAPGASSPHAWAEVYLPALGWVELDATNGLVDGGDLIPVASATSGAELTPISGSFTGFGATATMTVAVDITKTG